MTERTQSHVRWMLCGPISKMEFEVVRVTTTHEHLAGPFKTKRQAEKWIVDNQAQPTLIEGVNATLVGADLKGNPHSEWIIPLAPDPGRRERS